MHDRAGSRSTPAGRIAAAITGVLLTVALVSPAAAAVDPPFAADDTITTLEDTVATGNVLANDVDPNGGTVIKTTQGHLSTSVGRLTISSNGDYTFTPAANWNGFVSVWYQVTNGYGIAVASVNITVTAVNDAPVAADHTASGTEDTDTDVTAATMKAGATDVENDAVTVTGVSNAAGGSVAWASNVATFTPDQNLCGEAAATFGFTISDGHGGTDTGRMTLDLECTNDPPTPVDDTLDATEDTEAQYDAADVLGNDEDIDDATPVLTVTGVSGATHGTVALDAGVITFTPEADFCGDASFDYDAEDTDGAPGSATATVDVACVNDAPVAVDDTAEIVQATLPDPFDVAANDADVDGDTLAATAADVDPSAGTATVEDGKVVFVPERAFTGDAVITYTVSDGDLTDEGTLTVTVTADTTDPVATIPTVTFGTGRVNESAPLLITWTGTDAESGVDGCEVEVNVGGTGFVPAYAGNATSVTKLYAFNRSLVWRVRATDRAGNVGEWVVSATRKLVANQGGTPTARKGTWITRPTLSASGTGYLYTTTSGAKESFPFTGREVIVVVTKNPKSGYAKVYVDGVVKGRFNEWRSSTAYGSILYKATFATSGSHRVAIVNDQGGRRTNLDAFIVLQ